MDDRLRDQHQRDLAATRDEFTKAIASLQAVQSMTLGRDRGIGLSWGIMVAAIGTLVGLTGLLFALFR